MNEVNHYLNTSARLATNLFYILFADRSVSNLFLFYASAFGTSSPDSPSSYCQPSTKKMFQHSTAQTFLTLTAVTYNITELFGPSLSPKAEIFLRSDPKFSEQVTQRWTTHEAPSYAGAIKPSTEADIQNIVSVQNQLIWQLLVIC
jgi:hypothetical protein